MTTLLIIAVSICLVFSIVCFVLFVCCARKRFDAQRATRDLLPTATVDVAKIVEAVVKLLEALDKATCTTVGLFGATLFLLIALYVLTHFPH